MGYIICTGQLETGTQEQQAAFVRLFGPEQTREAFDFYFHWYNIAHEYGHCLCSHYDAETLGLEQEGLVNRFAVSLWSCMGYEKELDDLQKLAGQVLQRLEDPVPKGVSFADYYRQIWDTPALMEVPVYGYFQFRSVQTALENRADLRDVLREMGVKEAARPCTVPYKKYRFSVQTASEALRDIRHFLRTLGIEQPDTEVMLTGDPAVQCVQWAG